jgi:Fe2+ transport system protein B
MNEIIKKITKNKVIGHILAACIILLVLSLVINIVKCNWVDVFNDAIWIFVAFMNFKMMSRISSLEDVINCQERFIDRICDAIEKAKKQEETE